MCIKLYIMLIVFTALLCTIKAYETLSTENELRTVLDPSQDSSLTNQNAVPQQTRNEDIRSSCNESDGSDGDNIQLNQKVNDNQSEDSLLVEEFLLYIVEAQQEAERLDQESNVLNLNTSLPLEYLFDNYLSTKSFLEYFVDSEQEEEKLLQEAASQEQNSMIEIEIRAINELSTEYFLRDIVEWELEAEKMEEEEETIAAINSTALVKKSANELPTEQFLTQIVEWELEVDKVEEEEAKAVLNSTKPVENRLSDESSVDQFLGHIVEWELEAEKQEEEEEAKAVLNSTIPLKSRLNIEFSAEQFLRYIVESEIEADKQDKEEGQIKQNLIIATNILNDSDFSAQQFLRFIVESEQEAEKLEEKAIVQDSTEELKEENIEKKKIAMEQSPAIDSIELNNRIDDYSSVEQFLIYIVETERDVEKQAKRAMEIKQDHPSNLIEGENQLDNQSSVEEFLTYIVESETKAEKSEKKAMEFSSRDSMPLQDYSDDYLSAEQFLRYIVESEQEADKQYLMLENDSTIQGNQLFDCVKIVENSSQKQKNSNSSRVYSTGLKPKADNFEQNSTINSTVFQVKDSENQSYKQGDSDFSSIQEFLTYIVESEQKADHFEYRLLNAETIDNSIGENQQKQILSAFQSEAFLIPQEVQEI